MAKKFQTLEERMSEESRARAQGRAEELLTEERSVSVHDLVRGIEASFAEVQERVVADVKDAPPTSVAELEQMVGDALRKIRSRNR